MGSQKETPKVPETITITKVDIKPATVLKYMEKHAKKDPTHWLTAVQLRDKYNWPLRGTARRLMKVLAETGTVVIEANPDRKNSYCYGLPGQSKPVATPKVVAETAVVEEPTVEAETVVENAPTEEQSAEENLVSAEELGEKAPAES